MIKGLILTLIIAVVFSYKCLFGQVKDTVIIKEITSIFIFSYETGKPNLLQINLNDTTKVFIIYPATKREND